MKQFKLGLKASLGMMGGLVMAVMLTVGTWVTPAVPAYAATPTPPAERGIVLEYMLQLEQLRLAGQQDRLDQAREFVVITQAFVDELKAEGKDTSALETALANFGTQIDTAQASHDAAEQILDAKAGFDANGKVTDPQQARETLRSARQLMIEAGQTMKQALMDLREAVREFRQVNQKN